MVNQRVPHKLKHNKRSTIPSHFLFVDTETTDTSGGELVERHQLFLGVAQYARYERGRGLRSWPAREFYDLEGFYEILDEHAYKKQVTYVIAHNWGFDSLILDLHDELARRGWSCLKYIHDNMLNIYKYRRETSTIVFLDNVNYFKMSLAALGDAIGSPKLDMPGDYDDPDAWLHYCENDVKIMVDTWAAWLKYIDESDLGNFSFTISGQAMNAFRHRFMTQPIFIHANDKLVDLERDGYFGGRSECFFIGDLPEFHFYMVDVNSMYPWVMANKRLPVKAIGHYKDMRLGRAQECLRQYGMMARCRVQARQPRYPYRKNGKLLFPVGEFETVLTTPELVTGIMYGDVKSIGECAVYELSHIFYNYVYHFYNERLNFTRAKDTVKAFLCKLFLNSLYGKFAQKSPKWETVAVDDPGENRTWTEYNTRDRKNHTYRVINGTVEEQVGKYEGRDSFVAIAAHITAHARAKLWELRGIAGPANVYYVDTDSLIVNRAGLVNLHDYINDGALGMLKVEREAEKCTIRNVKDYKFGEYSRIKGVKKDAVELAPGVYEQKEFEGPRQALKQGYSGEVHIKTVVKTVNSRYDKGLITPSGWTEPFRLPELGP